MTKLELTIRQEMQIDQAATAGIASQRIAEIVSTKEVVVTVGQVLACLEDTRKFRAEQEALERDFEAINMAPLQEEAPPLVWAVPRLEFKPDECRYAVDADEYGSFSSAAIRQ